MEAKYTVSITEARKKIFDIASDVQKPGRYYVLTEKGRPKAVVLSADEFESWQETAEILEENPNITDDIKRAEKELERGEIYTLEEVLKGHGFVLADKEKKRSYVPRRTRKKGKKASR